MLISKTGPAERQNGGAGPLPVAFVVGVTRSGTTLLRMMLDAHPALAVPPETHFLPEVIEACRASPTPADCFFRVCTNHPRWDDFRALGPELQARIAARKPFDLSEALRTFYGLYAERFGKPRWSDKTPAYVYHMRLIQSVLPEARFVHLIRDGRDAALSVKDLSFGPNSIADAAHLWVERIRAAREQAAELRCYLEIRYEDLVLDPEATLEKVCAFIELPWDPAMLNYHTRSAARLAEMNRDVKDHAGRTIVSAQERLAVHALLTRPPQPGRVRRWGREMSRAERECYEAIAGDTLRELGYDG